MRPGRPSRTAVALVAVSAALWGVAKATGSGWIIVVVSVAAGLAVTGVVVPALLLTRLRLSATAPSDATAGEPAALTITVSGPQVRLRCLDPPGDWHHGSGGDVGALSFIAEHRGVIHQVELDAECAAPLGIMWWRRRLTLSLPSELVVGPAVLVHDGPIEGIQSGNDGDQVAHRPGDGDMVRGAREYRSGDPVRLLHWAASAKRGQPMVKELERDPVAALVVSVDLSGPPADQDVAAGRAAGLCAAALAAGRPTVLLTLERQREVADAVATVVDVSRRLGRAAAVPPRPVPGHLVGAEAVVVTAWDGGAESGNGRSTG